MSDFKTKMYQNRFRGAYSTPPDPLADLMGPTSMRRAGKGKGREGERQEGRRGERGREEKGGEGLCHGFLGDGRPRNSRYQTTSVVV